MSKRTIAILLLVSILAWMLSSCNSGFTESPPKAKQYYEYFDTVSVIYSYCGDTDAEFKSNCTQVSDILSEYHKLFDIYYEYSGINNLKTVNKNAGIAPVKVDAKLIDFLLYAKEIYALTDGEVNIALGSVLKLWHKARDAASISPELAYVPTEAELSSAIEHASIDDIVIDEENSTVFLRDPEMSVDVGALGKGYAAELARLALIDKGVTSYVLNIGGNICTIGEKPNGGAWRTSIKSPTEAGKYALTVDLRDISCVTSGNYERYYTFNGVNYHHIIDKDTLMPSAYFSSVTVFTKDSALADALSTALFSMSLEDGLKLIDELGCVDAYWITVDGEEYMTDGVRSIISK